MPEKQKITAAIISIPNTGKSTLFNALTGAHQAVGNWPGVSVEKKTGKFSINGYEFELIDLPGSYSLTPTTLEEKIVRKFILETPPDVLINIVDARNLYRSLGLTLQLAQSGIPMVVAVNMMDEARRLGIKIDTKALSDHLGVPVVPIIARTGEGLGHLTNTLIKVVKGELKQRPPQISCPIPLQKAVQTIAHDIKQIQPSSRLNEVFVAERLLDDLEPVKISNRGNGQDAQLQEKVNQARLEIEKNLGMSIPTACAQCRFNSAKGLMLETTTATVTASDEVTKKLDSVFLHKYLGIPIFLGIIFILFQGIYALGTPLQDLLGNGFAALQDFLRASTIFQTMPDFLSRMIIDGVIEGVGVVIAFFPIIALFFIFMSLIEDSGYMARAAFLLDHLMHVIGLDGKAFINVLLGYGCNVPAIMGTRILSSHHNRIITMLVIPFTLCSARLQVFLFVAGILFAPTVAPWIIFGFYLFSFLMVILIGLFLKKVHFAGEPEPFIMEIPPYRLPTVKTVALRAWEEMKAFLNRASTMIVLGVIAVWLLTNLPSGATTGIGQTWAVQIGKAVEPIFHPLGIEWQQIIALLFGFIAKEIVIGSLAIVYAGDPAQQIATHVTPLQGISFMVFTLLYTPCVATIAAIRAESQSWKITTFTIGLGLSLAWISSFIVYQIGSLLGF